MSAPVFLLVMLGGGIGAVLRFTIDGLITSRIASSYAWGTFVINATGSFLLGLLTGLSDSSVLSVDWLAVLGGGVMGGYTTFGTAMVHLVEDRAYGRAVFSALGMIVVTVLLALLGLVLGRSV